MKPLIICIAILAVFSTGCRKYLDAKPDSNVTIPSTLEDLQALLDKADYMNQRTACFDEASAGDYFLTDDVYSSLNTTNQQAYTWDLKDYLFANDWSNTYFVVYNANLCLSVIPSIERTAANGGAWDNIKGSALLYRGMSFLKLAWIFSNAYDENTAADDYGIALRTGADFNEPSVRASVAATYGQVINDLQASVPLLPETPQHVMRPSKAAAYGLLARTYLSMRLYDSAYKYASLCLGIKNELMDYNEIDTVSSAPFESFNKEVIFHTDISTYSISAFSPRYGLTDTLLFASYNVDDMRRPVFFNVAAGYPQFKGSYANSTPFSVPLFTGLATDELYLTRAECAARMGDKNEALADLNTLMVTRWRKNRFQPFTAASADDALALVLKERRKELLFRGLRWMDIKRLNKEGAGINITRVVNGMRYTLEPGDPRFALPLPADVIDAGSMPQNPW